MNIYVADADVRHDFGRQAGARRKQRGVQVIETEQAQWREQQDGGEAAPELDAHEGLLCVEISKHIVMLLEKMARTDPRRRGQVFFST